VIVVDIGCATYEDYPDDESVHKLVARFQPQLLFGFDPDPAQAEGAWTIGETFCVFSRQAAWVHGGTVAFERDPLSLRSKVGSGPPVPCFDLPAWLAAFPAIPIVLKLDAEGAEYALLERIITRGLDSRVSLVLVEWHERDGWEERRDEILSDIACPVEEW
jgi:hypothetical protein